MNSFKSFLLRSLIVLLVPQVSMAAGPFASKIDLFKKLYAAGFEYIVETPYSRDLRIKFLAKDGTYKPTPVNFDNGDPVLKYVEALAFFDKDGKQSHAYKVGNTLVCFTKESYSLITGTTRNELKDCLIFPYNVDDVVEAIKEV